MGRVFARSTRDREVAMQPTLNAICMLPRDLRDRLLRRLACASDADLAGIEVELAAAAERGR